MNFKQFLEQIKAFDKAGLEPDGLEWHELVKFFKALDRKAPNLFVPDRLEMINRVLFRKNYLESTEQKIDFHKTYLDSTIEDGLILDIPDPAGKFKHPTTKKEAMVAKYYFEEGLKLGASIGVLTDPVRLKALEVSQKRQSAPKSSSYWSPFAPKIESAIHLYLSREIPTQEQLREYIGTEINPRKILPAKSTVSLWISRYKKYGSILKGLNLK